MLANGSIKETCSIVRSYFNAIFSLESIISLRLGKADSSKGMIHSSEGIINPIEEIINPSKGMIHSSEEMINPSEGMIHSNEEMADSSEEMDDTHLIPIHLYSTIKPF